MRSRRTWAVPTTLLALALLGGGVGTVPADAAAPPADTLADATPEQQRCITRNAGTERAKAAAWRRKEPRYLAYRAVLDAAYKRVTGHRYHYNAPLEGVPFGLLGHGLDERTGRVILLVDPTLIDRDRYARHLDKVARRANAYRKVPAGQRISVAVQPGCFPAREIDELRDRMRSLEYGSRGELVQRVGRDVEFDGRLHVLIHVADRARGEELRRREGPKLAIYWTTKNPRSGAGDPDDYVPPPRHDDLSDATAEQRACITRNDRLAEENEAGVYWRDIDRRQQVGQRLVRVAIKVATGHWAYERRGDRLESGLFGWEYDYAHDRIVFQVDPLTQDLPAFQRAMDAAARKANRAWNTPPMHTVRVLAQPSCFPAAEMLALRERMQAAARPACRKVNTYFTHIGWDGRMHVWVESEHREYGEELRRREGPIVRVHWGSLAPDRQRCLAGVPLPTRR